MEMTPHRVAADSGVTLRFSFFLLFFPSFVPGKYHCPVLYNVFSNNTHIVANKVTGNVFSYEVSEVVHNLQGYSHSGHNLSPRGLTSH